MLYQKPEMEILKFGIEDVICASVGGVYGDDNNTDVGGDWTQKPN